MTKPHDIIRYAVTRNYPGNRFGVKCHIICYTFNVNEAEEIAQDLARATYERRHDEAVEYNVIRTDETFDYAVKYTKEHLGYFEVEQEDTVIGDLGTFYVWKPHKPYVTGKEEENYLKEMEKIQDTLKEKEGE